MVTKHSNESELEAAFLEDHRRFTRGLAHVKKALDADDLELAVRTARELDLDVGPHIDFEERYFYPELARMLGREFVDQLYAEHRVGQRAIAGLVECAGRAHLEPRRKDELLGQLDTAMRHALSCGSLLSHLERLEPAERDELHRRLLEVRRSGRRWTELPERGVGEIERRE